MKESHLSVKVSLMKTLWQPVITIMQPQAKITFGQDRNIHEMLEVSKLSLELSVD
jgi:hypothetical protein